MGKNTLTTAQNEGDVFAFIEGVEDEDKRKDCFTLMEIMKEITGAEPKMWGGSIVGFGSYHFMYASGQEGDWFLTGFSPRKQNLTIYIMPGFERFQEIMEQGVQGGGDGKEALPRSSENGCTEHGARRYS